LSSDPYSNFVFADMFTIKQSSDKAIELLPETSFSQLSKIYRFVTTTLVSGDRHQIFLLGPPEDGDRIQCLKYCIFKKYRMMDNVQNYDSYR
jgi:hypothetical protein